MGFLKKLLGVPEKVHYYSDDIAYYKQIYCPTKTYEEDNIDPKLIKNLFVLGSVFDGINVKYDIVHLKYSMLLEDEFANVWGVASISEAFGPHFVDKNIDFSRAHVTNPYISEEDNISNKQIFITDVCPLDMTSMFYRDGDQFYFYARSAKGIYFRIWLEPKHYVMMEYMKTLLNNKTKLSSISAAPILKLGDIILTAKISFSKDNYKDDIVGITYIDEKVLILVKSTDISYLVCYCSLKGTNKNTIAKFKNHPLYIEDMSMHINYLRTNGNKVFMLRNKIDCGYIVEGKSSNIVTSYIFFEDYNKVQEGEKATTNAIRIYPPAYESLCKGLLHFIHEDITK